MTTITTAKAREIAHYMNMTVHDIRALAISRGVTIDDTPVDDTETDAEEQEAAGQDDVVEKVARAIADADRAFRGLEPMQDSEWRNYWSPGGPAALPSQFAMRADAAIRAIGAKP